MIGPWIDSTQFRDLDLLEKLGRHNRDTAVGVLANRNVTGAVLARVAEGANLVVANVEALGGGATLLAGRTPEDQIVIVMAAVARSEAAAKALTAHLCPQAALTLYRRATATRFKGASVLREGIEEMVDGRGFLTNAHLPGYQELVEAVLGTPNQARRLLTLAACHYDNPAALSALAPLMANLPTQQRDSGDPDVQGLLLLTHGHPEVVEHWGRHGGALGAQVAIVDHRQNGDWLVQLAEQNQGWSSNDAVMANPAVPYAVRAQLRGNEFAELLVNGGPTAVHRIGVLAKSSQTLIQHGAAFKDVDVSTAESRGRHHRLVAEACVNQQLAISQLFRFETLLSEKTTANQREQLLTLLLTGTQVLWPGTMNEPLLARIGTTLPGNHYARLVLNAMAPDRFNTGPSQEEADPTVQTFNSGWFELPSRQGRGHHGAHAVAQQVTTIAAFEKLYEEVGRIVGDRSAKHGRDMRLNVVLHTVARETRLVAPDDAIYDLIPNALGAF